MNRVAILGSGDFAEQIAELCTCIDGHCVAGFFDGNRLQGSRVAGYPVLGDDNEVVSLFQKGTFDSIFIGIGYEHFDLRHTIFRRFFGRVPMAQIVHPTAIISPSVRMGQNVLVAEGAIVGKGCVISDGVTILQGVVLSHDTHVGSHSYIAPRAALAGHVSVGEKCFIGLNCSIRDNVTIGDEVTIGIGGVVIRDVPHNEIVVGNPQRTIDTRQGGVTDINQCVPLPCIEKSNITKEMAA